MERLHGFQPAWSPECKLLILGSMPSVASLGAHQYYAHPRNQFWRLIGDVLGDVAPIDYAQRLDWLVRHGVALWDVCRSCERDGSSDSKIRAPITNDVAVLMAKLDLRAIGVNGSTALRLFRRQVDTELPVLALPSSSPAHTMSYRDKLEQWLALRQYVDLL